MKQLLLITLCFTTCLAGSKATTAAQARNDLQHLFNSSATWTREYLIDHPAPKKQAANQLTATHEQLSSTFGSVYGKQIAAESSTLLNQQAALTIALIDAIKKNDTDAQKDVANRWKNNASALSRLLDRTNPYISYQKLNTLLLDYLAQLIKMATDYTKKSWDNDAANYTTLRHQMHTIASYIGKTFTDAFPKHQGKIKLPTSGNQSSGVPAPQKPYR